MKAQLDEIQAEAFRFQSSRAREISETRDTIVALLKDIKMQDSADTDSSEDERAVTTQALQEFPNQLTDIGQRLRSLESTVRGTPGETRLLQQLFYKGIYGRADSLTDASKGTFEWIMGMDNPSRHQLDDRKLDARTRFQDWMASEKTRNAFHISGKAGSGKSTFLKLVYEHAGTHKLLQRWSRDNKLLCAAFYFWDLGNTMQKSLQGFYRSILFEILRQSPELIPALFEDQWKALESISVPELLQTTDIIRPADIQKAITKLMRLTNEDDGEKYRICLFIDGLDELEGDCVDHCELAMQLQEWSTNDRVKICVSSRPHTEFLDVFSEQYRIHLHQLTTEDIAIFGRKMFESMPPQHFQRVEDLYERLVSQVVFKSEGVFLWARLAVRSLILEVYRHASNDSLLDRVDGLQPGLISLYDGMLASMDSRDRVRAHQVLYHVLLNPFKEPLNALSLDWLDKLETPGEPPVGKTYTTAEVAERTERIRRELDGLTNGILEIVPIDGYGKDFGRFFQHRVQFFHRSVKEYLNNPERKKALAAAVPNLNKPAKTFTMIRLAEAVSVDETQLPSSIEWNCHMCEPLRLDHSDASGTWSYPYKDRQDALRLLTRPRLIPQLDMFVYTQGGLVCHDAVNNDSSFIHVCAVYNQFDFVIQELDSNHPECLDMERYYGQAGGEVDNIGSPRCPRKLRAPSERSLLLSGMFSTVPRLEQDFGALCRFVNQLLDRGVSAKRAVALAKGEDNPVDSASAWVILCIDAFCKQFALVPNSHSTQRFVLCSLLVQREGLEEPVFMLHEKAATAPCSQWKDVVATHFITFQQLALICCDKAEQASVLECFCGHWGSDARTSLPEPWISKWESLGYRVTDRPRQVPPDQWDQFELAFVGTKSEAVGWNDLCFRLY